MDALEKELKEIKQRLVSSPVQDAVVSQSPGASTDVDTTDAYQSCLPPVLTELKHDAKLISRTIGDVELDPLAISALLEEYGLFQFNSITPSLTTVKDTIHTTTINFH
jgi:hypothetical protein